MGEGEVGGEEREETRWMKGGVTVGGATAVQSCLKNLRMKKYCKCTMHEQRGLPVVLNFAKAQSNEPPFKKPMSPLDACGPDDVGR